MSSFVLPVPCPLENGTLGPPRFEEMDWQSSTGVEQGHERPYVSELTSLGVKPTPTPGLSTRLHVLGIPRIDLSNISWRIKNYKTKPDVLNRDLPYEIIIVGVYKD